MDGTFRAGTWRLCRVLIEENPPGRGVRVVELAALDGPEKCAEEAAGDQAAGDDEQDDDAHGSLRAARRMAPAPRPTTVSELTGMRIAEASGVSAPLTASDSATTL